MTLALIKKQLLEVFAWVYRNPKTGSRRSKRGIALYCLLYLALFGFLGVIFYELAEIMCEPFMSLGLEWLYWALMSLVAIFIGAFGSIFNTYASLYLAKDNELLLSMPIPPSKVLVARLTGVYAMGVMYELIVMIPCVIARLRYDFGLFALSNSLIITLVISLVILLISALLGFIVAAISTRLKNRSILTVIISLVFIAVYYFIAGNASSILSQILTSPQSIGERVRGFAYPLYVLGRAASGDPMSLLLSVLLSLLLVVALFFVLSRTFLKFALAGSVKTNDAVGLKTKKRKSVFYALLRRELKRFASSSSYMLNAGLGIVFMPLVAFGLLWKADDLREALSLLPFSGYAPIFAVGIVFLASSINDMTASCVSLEGKTLWLLKSIPADERVVLGSKLAFGLVLTLIPAVFPTAAVLFVIKVDAGHAILVVASVALLIFAEAVVGLLLDLRFASFSWSSEVVPIKQGLPVTLTLFGSWIFLAVLGVLCFLTRNVVSPTVFLALWAVLLLALDIILVHTLFTAGVRRFKNL